MGTEICMCFVMVGKSMAKAATFCTLFNMQINESLNGSFVTSGISEFNFKIQIRTRLFWIMK